MLYFCIQLCTSFWIILREASKSFFLHLWWICTPCTSFSLVLVQKLLFLCRKFTLLFCGLLLTASCYKMNFSSILEKNLALPFTCWSLCPAKALFCAEAYFLGSIYLAFCIYLFIYFYSFLFCFVFFFLWQHLQHMEIPRLGIKLELQLRPTLSPQQCQLQDASATYATAMAKPDP